MKIRNITKLKTKYRLYSSDRFRFNKIELHSTETGSVTFSRNWIMCGVLLQCGVFYSAPTHILSISAGNWYNKRNIRFNTSIKIVKILFTGIII